MKITIYVDYSNAQFNNDFVMANRLIAGGHNVFLAVNDNQFEELKKNCDIAILGYSFDRIDKKYMDSVSIDKTVSIDDMIKKVINYNV